MTSQIDQNIPACGRHVVFTDLALELPHGCYGRIATRSGLASLWGIDVGAGVIDPDFKGKVGVLLFNHSDAIWVGILGFQIKLYISSMLFSREKSFMVSILYFLMQ